MIIEMLLMGCFDFAPIHNPRKEIDATNNTRKFVLEINWVRDPLLR
jgi:hypothetical protein